MTHIFISIYICVPIYVGILYEYRILCFNELLLPFKDNYIFNYIYLFCKQQY